jgi:hypothetical protein
MSAPTLTTVELGAVEQVLDMGSGYVLGFNNRAFAMFFADLDVEIEPEESGLSKANRLRAFLRSGTPSEVARVLAALLDARGEREGDKTFAALRKYKEIVSRLEGISVSMGSPQGAAGCVDAPVRAGA